MKILIHNYQVFFNNYILARSPAQDLYGTTIKKPEDISLIELSPAYIANNFNSRPKTHWIPPKPVLLNNFETSIGSQLGDIAKLTTYCIFFIKLIL